MIHASHLSPLIFSLINGALLGQAYCEKSIKNYRIIFSIEHPNVEFLFFLWKSLSSHSLCTPNRPKITSRPTTKGITRTLKNFKTYTSSIFNPIYAD